MKTPSSLFRTLLFVFLTLIFLAGCNGGSENGSDNSTDTFGNTGDGGSWTGWGDGTVPTGGNIYYVSQTGSDSNEGTEARPWGSPGYGSKQLRPGDTMIIKSGVYKMSFNADMITPVQSGTVNGWIMIKGEEGHNRPLIQGNGGLLAAIEIGGHSYIWIEGIEITSDTDTPYAGGLRNGIEAGGASEKSISNVVIRDVEVHHVEEAGINFDEDISNVAVEDVYIYYTGGPSINTTIAEDDGTPDTEGGSGWANVVISGSTLEYAGAYSNGEEMQSSWDRTGSLGVEDSIGPLEIKNTISRDNLGNGIDSRVKNTYIHECIIANNYGDGIRLRGGGSRVENTLIYGTGYPSPLESTSSSLLVIDTNNPDTGVEIVNVTMFDDAGRPAHYSMKVQYESCDGEDYPLSLTLQNNIIAGLDRAFLRDCVTLTAGNNLFYNRMDTEGIQLTIEGSEDTVSYTSSDVSSLGTGNIYGDPLFEKAEWGPDGDFHLRPGSPAIDRGNSIEAPSVDISGVSRPQGEDVDIGAYEK